MSPLCIYSSALFLQASHAVQLLTVELVVTMAFVIFAGQYLQILLSYVCCWRMNENVARHQQHIKHLFAPFLFDSLPLS